MASELIIQLQNRDGSFNCEKFDNLPSPKSVFIAICFTDNARSEQLAIDLKLNLIKTIASFNNNLISSPPPCRSETVGFNTCQALSVQDNLKLLIVVSDGNSSTLAEPEVLKWTHTILPVLQLGKIVTLPSPLNIPNAVFWNSSIDEVMPTIFGLIGISEEVQRIFISYRRSDTSELAEQLFDRLSHEGFDVFLDRFSINPGVNFQNRLSQELADKAMIVFLESPDFLKSPWIQLEIAFAKQNRLGILALNIDNAKKTESIDDDYRIPISINKKDGKLSSPSIDQIVVKIKEQHSVALYRMKNYLTANIIAAIENNGGTTSFDRNGFISVPNQNGGNEYKIWATPRPPMLKDYHYTDVSNPLAEKIIVGPRFIEERRGVINTWLSQKSVVEFYNEGRILDLADLIYP